MGNDGGSIPKRRELVKEAARLQTASEAKESQQENQEHRWKTCILSQQPLKPPIVSDYLGNLYNKDAILEYLLPSEDPTIEAAKADKDKILDGRVTSLRDVAEVKFQEERESKDQAATSRWLCPVSSKVLGPSVKAVYLVPCGHAFSEAAIKEVSSETCLQCNSPYSPENIIPIHPTTSSEISRLKVRASTLKSQSLTHALKKAPGSSKKRKKDTMVVVASSDTKSPSTSTLPSTNGFTNPSSGTTKNTQPNTIKNPATASLTAKVLAEEQEKAKRRKLEPNENLKSLFSSVGTGGHKDGDFMTRGFSIPAGARR